MNPRTACALVAVGILVVLLAVSSLPVAAGGGLPPGQAAATLTAKEQLGKRLFFDTNLSDPPGQACSACHAAEVGFTGPSAAINRGGGVYEGAVPGRFGNRKPPSSAYAGDSPRLHFDEEAGAWIGGMFWDGRATGDVLGDPLAEQAQGPFLNPLEQNLASARVVVGKVKASQYQALFRSVCGSGGNVADLYNCVGRAIAAYERSGEVSAFTSKYDQWLEGTAQLTGQERLGWELFTGKANCKACHPSPNFTDFTYDNLGLPKNPANPFYNEPQWNPAGQNWVDEGLGAYLKGAGFKASVYQTEMGKHKVPTLRNVAKAPSPDTVKSFGHNGYFKSLEDVVHFYNTRDVPGANWPAPEVADNVNRKELGNLGLTNGEEKALVAFLGTLSDGYGRSKP